jgi:hypothetical protein
MANACNKVFGTVTVKNLTADMTCGLDDGHSGDHQMKVLPPKILAFARAIGRRGKAGQAAAAKARSSKA